MIVKARRAGVLAVVVLAVRVAPVARVVVVAAAIAAASKRIA